MNDTWEKFPNGKVWRVHEGYAEGSVMVPGYLDLDGLEAQLDAIAEAVTGSLAGLTDFSYQYRGDDIVTFSGSVAEMLSDEGEEIQYLDGQSDVLRTALAAQYDLMEIEVEHVLDNLDTKYAEECVLGVVGSYRELRCPAHPVECDYVRIVVDGLEIAYWCSDEWQCAPGEVMGAIFGAARGASL